MVNKISILLQAQDNASQKIRNLGDQIQRTGKESEVGGKRVGSLREHVGALAGVAVAAGVATRSLFGFMGDTTTAATKLQSALIGLNSIARAFGQDADAAKRAAQELASDGLMTVTDSATGLKNLLASGFSLDQATTLMIRFKDSAAFGRQSALSFGQAISSATEGIKNGNSILVDNAGVTKNLSVMLQEAGFSSQDLMKATTDASIRQAIFNGILKETNAQTGDAARLAESAAGKQAQLSAQTEVLYQKMGTALQPALLALLSVVTPIVVTLADWISKNPELAAGIVIATTALVGLVTVVSATATAVTALLPVFALFKVAAIAAAVKVGVAFTAMKAIVLTPLVMPALAVAAALASIALVVEAVNSVKRAMDALDQAKEAQRVSAEAGASLRGVADRKFNAGQIDRAERDRLYGVSYRSIGTNYAAAGATMVGEHGPELVNLPAGSRVSPAWKTRADASSEGAGGVTNILSGNFTFESKESVEAFFSRIDKTQRLAKWGMAA